MMSKQLSILAKISSEQSLFEAWRLLNKSNKTSKGLSNVSIKDFETNLKNHVSEISKSLQSNKYIFSKVKGVTIPKKDGKPRPLRVPEIKDRLVHKVLAIEFEKILSTKFKLKNKCSFAYQSGIGLIDAIAQMLIYYQDGYKIILEADIIKFFPSVDSISLIDKIKKSLPDDSVNDLFEKAIGQELGNVQELKNKKVYEEHFLDSELGIPQGNALSPLLANICLSEFDQRMINEDIKMVRYADDFIILCKDKNEAYKSFNIALEELEQKLKLKVYPLETLETKGEKASRIIDPRGVSFKFLSIRFDGIKCWVDEKKVDSLIEKLKTISSMEERKKVVKEEIWLLQGLIKIKNLLEGWIAAYYFIDIAKQIDEIDKNVDIELLKLFTSFNFSLKQKDLKKITLKGKSNERWGLGDIQRKFIGLPTCKVTLEKMRANKDTLEEVIKTKRKIAELDI
jgi:RNA-directed DNA polymerase